MISYLISLIPVIIYPYLAARKDFIQIESNGRFDSLKKEFHFINVCIRVLIFTTIGFIVYKSIIGFIGYLLLAFSIHWFIFDRRLNKHRDLPADYLGENAFTDRLLKKYPYLKYLILIGSIGFYLISFVII